MTTELPELDIRSPEFVGGQPNSHQILTHTYFISEPIGCLYSITNVAISYILDITKDAYKNFIALYIDEHS